MKRNSFFIEDLASFTIEVYSMIEMDNKMFKMRFRSSEYVFEELELKLFSYVCDHVFIHRTSNFLQSHCGQDLAECTFIYYPNGRNISFLICLLCCNVDFSELSLHLNHSHLELQARFIDLATL